MHVIDRRQNPNAKSLGNRQRFVRRVKNHVREAVKEAIQSRGVGDLESSEEISIDAKDVREPSFHLDPDSGERDYVFPGNHGYQRGDRIRKPAQPAGGRGAGGSPDGDGEDQFVFTLTQDEFLDLFFEDLELPNLAKRKLKTIDALARRRAGYANDGSPMRLNKKETMRRSLARRIALGRPRLSELAAMESALDRELDVEQKRLLEQERRLEQSPDRASRTGWSRPAIELDSKITAMRSRMQVIPFLDTVDMRYNRFESVPNPTTQAVMFCLMDTSASMTEPLKDLAKRFYMLLHLFLNRHYRAVELVFIRHTYTATEVDEQTFFHGRETGGTIVSSALEEMLKIVEQRYPLDDWNIYAAQASDGHNFDHDMYRTLQLLEQEILPRCQYYAYIEVSEEQLFNESVLWGGYSEIIEKHPQFARASVYDPSDIYPVFHDLFTGSHEPR